MDLAGDALDHAQKFAAEGEFDRTELFSVS